MTDDNFQNLALNESFERVAKVAEERADHLPETGV
jgi:hypothetical protein